LCGKWNATRRNHDGDGTDLTDTQGGIPDVREDDPPRAGRSEGIENHAACRDEGKQQDHPGNGHAHSWWQRGSPVSEVQRKGACRVTLWQGISARLTALKYMLLL